MEPSGCVAQIFGHGFHLGGWATVLYLGLPWAQGRIHPKVTKIVKPPLLKARWAHSVFHWYNHLAAIFVLFFGLEDIIAHIETLTEFTQQALNDSRQSLSLLNNEISLMRNAVLLNWMALDIITVSKGSTCAIIQIDVVCSYLMSLIRHHLY